MDEDLVRMTREQLIDEIRKLRQGFEPIATAAATSCAGTIPRLWGLLPEKQDPLPLVPEWPEFLRGCIRDRQSLDEQAPGAPRSVEPYDNAAAKGRRR